MSAPSAEVTRVITPSGASSSRRSVPLRANRTVAEMVMKMTANMLVATACRGLMPTGDHDGHVDERVAAGDSPDCAGQDHEHEEQRDLTGAEVGGGHQLATACRAVWRCPWGGLCRPIRPNAATARLSAGMMASWHGRDARRRPRSAQKPGGLRRRGGHASTSMVHPRSRRPRAKWTRPVVRRSATHVPPANIGGPNGAPAATWSTSSPRSCRRLSPRCTGQQFAATLAGPGGHAFTRRGRRGFDDAAPVRHGQLAG